MDQHPESADSLVEELGEILREGPPSEVLNEEETSMRFSDILDILAEDRDLGELPEIPEMTPDWSLIIRNYLEISHDRFDLEGESFNEGETETGDEIQEDAIFGIGLLFDLDQPLPESLTLENLGPIARLIETALSDSHHLVQVFLHPRVLSFADLYTFSYDSRRGFVEERLNFGFSMDSSGSLDEMPIMMADALLGDWDQPADDLLAPGDPVLKTFGKTREQGRGALLGVVRMTPPYDGEWGDILDERFSGELQEEIGKAMALILDTSPFERNLEVQAEGNISLVPWSLMLPMASTIEFGAFLAQRLEEGGIHPERVGMTPLWRDNSLWIEIEGHDSPKSSLRFLAIDEYVGQFMEHYVPKIMESMMGLSVRWNKRKGGGRYLSLGIV